MMPTWLVKCSALIKSSKWHTSGHLCSVANWHGVAQAVHWILVRIGGVPVVHARHFLCSFDMVYDSWVKRKILLCSMSWKETHQAWLS